MRVLLYKTCFSQESQHPSTSPQVWHICLDLLSWRLSRTRLLGLAQFCVLHKWHVSSSDGITHHPVIEIIKASLLYCACIAVRDLLLPGITTPILWLTAVTYLPGFILFMTPVPSGFYGPLNFVCHITVMRQDQMECPMIQYYEFIKATLCVYCCTRLASPRNHIIHPPAHNPVCTFLWKSSKNLGLFCTFSIYASLSLKKNLVPFSQVWLCSFHTILLATTLCLRAGP